MEVKLYNGEVEVKFNEGNHSYFVDGKRCKSVTSITGMLDNPALSFWALKMTGEYLNGLLSKGVQITPAYIQEGLAYSNQVKKEAAEIGSRVHDYCERFAIACMKGEPLPDVPNDIDDKIVSGINAFLDWYSQHDIKFLEIEKIIYSRKYNYVGKFDALCTIDGVLTLVDYKTSKGIWENQDWQLCGYKLAYEEELGNQNIVPMLLHFDKETGIFTPHIVTFPDAKMLIFSKMAELKNLLKE